MTPTEVSSFPDAATSFTEAFPPPARPNDDYDAAALAFWAQMYEEARTGEPRDYGGRPGHWWEGTLPALIKTIWPTLPHRQVASAQASISPRLVGKGMLANIRHGAGGKPSRWWVAAPPSSVADLVAAEAPQASLASEPEPVAAVEPVQESAPPAVVEPEPQASVQSAYAAPAGSSSGLTRLQEMLDEMVQQRAGEAQERVETARKGLHALLGDLDEFRVRVHTLLDQLD